MAFVNKQGGAEKHEDVAGAGEPYEFDPDDDSVVKVHYDLASWNFEQRAELAEALAENGIPHAWDGEELIVPEDVEAAADAMFERLEGELGPFPIVLDDDAESTEFGLDEWTDADRQVLTESLIESEVPFRWEGATVVVARDAEDAVDDLLDAIESGELMSADAEAAHEPPDGVLSDVYLAASKLVKDPMDAGARHTLIDLNGRIDADHPPYAFAPRTWQQTVAGVAATVDRIVADADADDGDDESSELVELADGLRSLLRPYV